MKQLVAKMFVVLLALSAGTAAVCLQEIKSEITRSRAIELRRKSVEEYRKQQDLFVEKAYRQVLKDKAIEVEPNALSAALENQDSSVKLAAAYFLGREGRKSVAPVLRSLLGDSDSIIRLAAAEELATLGDASGLSAVIKETSNESATIRQTSVGLVLDFAKFPEKIPQVEQVLQRALEDENKDVRLTSAASMALLGDPSLILALKTARDKERDSSTKEIMAEHVRWLEYLQSLKP